MKIILLMICTICTAMPAWCLGLKHLDTSTYPAGAGFNNNIKLQWGHNNIGKDFLCSNSTPCEWRLEGNENIVIYTCTSIIKIEKCEDNAVRQIQMTEFPLGTYNTIICITNYNGVKDCHTDNSRATISKEKLATCHISVDNTDFDLGSHKPGIGPVEKFFPDALVLDCNRTASLKVKATIITSGGFNIKVTSGSYDLTEGEGINKYVNTKAKMPLTIAGPRQQKPGERTASVIVTITVF